MPQKSLLDFKNEFSDLFSSQEFVEAWEEWLVWRRESHWSINEAYKRRALKKLTSFGGVEAAIASLLDSTGNWQGLFPSKGMKHGSKTHTPTRIRNSEPIQSRQFQAGAVKKARD